jgi:hypothetical protein
VYGAERLSPIRSRPLQEQRIALVKSRRKSITIDICGLGITHRDVAQFARCRSILDHAASVLPIQSRQIIDPDLALIELDIAQPIVMPPTLLDRLYKPRIKRAALQDFHMTVIAQQERQSDTDEDQQQANMENKESRLCAKAPVRQ